MPQAEPEAGRVRRDRARRLGRSAAGAEQRGGKAEFHWCACPHHVSLGLARMIVETAERMDCDDHGDDEQDYRALVAVTASRRVGLSPIERRSQRRAAARRRPARSCGRSSLRAPAPVSRPGRGGWHNSRSPAAVRRTYVRASSKRRCSIAFAHTGQSLGAVTGQRTRGIDEVLVPGRPGSPAGSINSWSMGPRLALMRA